MAEIIRPFPQRVDLGARTWRPTRVSHIIELPPAPQWLWDNRVRRGEVTLLGGESKVGKSLLGQQLLSSAALGVPCLGRHTEKCRSFALFCEDRDEDLRRRQFDINAYLNVFPCDFEDRFCWQSMVGKDCVLADFEYGKMRLTGEWDRLWREIDAEESELIFIDTAAAVFAGNDARRNQVTPFMRALHQKAMERERQPSIVLAIHPPDANVRKGYAGSVAWLASARAGLSLERPQEYDPITDTPPYDRVLRGLGANYSGGRGSARLRFDINRKVFVADEPDESPPPRADSQGRRDAMIEELDRIVRLARFNGARIRADVLHAHSAPNYYRRMFDKRTSSNDLYAAQDDLLARRRWIRVRVGGECLLRPVDGAKYPDEEAWAI